MRLLILAIVACLAVATSSEKVVGGFKTTIESYPWQVSLRYNGQHFCGGTIHNSRRIITAAHCLSGIPLPLFSVLYGSTNSRYDIPPNQEIKVESYVIHEDYNTATLNNDIGIIKLAENIPFSDKARAIPIHDDHARDLVGEKCESSGWGNLTPGGSSPNTLYAVEMPIIPRHQSNYTSTTNYNDDTMIIAGLPGEGKDTCQGDSGGPLIWRGHKNQPVTLIGVVSWGYSCGWSGVYARVSKFHQWIKQNI